MKETSENPCFYFMIGFLWSLYSQIQYSCDVWEYLLELIKRRSKVQEKNMSCKCGLNFDQWKTLSENFKPMRVWLWLFYKFTKNYCCLQLFSNFIQTQKRYPASLDKICILTQKLLAISSQNFSCELHS